MARMVDLATTTYVWVAGETEPVTAAAVTAGTNISAYVVASTKVGPTSSDTVNEKSITDTSNSVVPIIGNYEGTLVLHRDLTAGAPTANDPLTTIGKASGIVGWLVKRVGYTSTTAMAATQTVDRFKFMTDTPQKSGGEGDGYLKVTIPMLQQGVFRTEIALT